MAFDNLKSKVLVMGGLIADKYLLVDNFPKRGEDVLINKAFNRVGGCTINVASALKNFDIDAFPVSAIGDDEDGCMIEKFLLESNINNSCVKVEKGKSTGYCLVILDSGSERTFMTFKGCEEIFSSDFAAPELLEQIGFVYLTGYYLLGSYSEEILKFIKDIKRLGAIIMFDPGPLLEEISKEILSTAINLCDVLIPNSSELDKIKLKLNITEDFNVWVQRSGISYLIIKNGSRGVTGFNEGKRYKHPAYNVKSIDTTGAGDSFAAGCIYGFIKGFDFDKVLNFGSAAGALNTTFIGPNGRFGIKDIERLIREENNNDR